MYIMLQTHSGIVFTVSSVSQFAQNFNATHYNTVKQIFHYSVKTATQDVTYEFINSDLLNYTDVD